MEEPPPPPPHLTVTTEATDAPPPSPRHHRKHLLDVRNSLRSSSPSSSLAPGPDTDRDDDAASNRSSTRLRDRLAAKLSRTHTADDDEDPNDPTSVIIVQDSRSQNAREESPESQDIYRWAVMVENQRGCVPVFVPVSNPRLDFNLTLASSVTLLGRNRYSFSSLLPNDPPPYTIPPESAHNNQSSITPHTLDDFQLPDASWLWVSKSWLVQMAGNGGSVDGYEYNWWFREKG